MRALFVSARSKVFWTTAIVLIGSLFVAGLTNYKISETAVYVGAIWMTLGVYSELESRGISWKGASLVSLGSGMLFAVAGYFLILKNHIGADVLLQIVEPLHIAIKKAFPDFAIEAADLIGYIPGIFIASLFGSLAVSFAFEAKVTRIFRMPRERVASGIRWLDYRLPDFAIWVILFAALFSEFNFEIKMLKLVSINIIIVAAVALLFQGVAVIEFMMRFYRFGLFSRMITYTLIFLQIAPFVAFLGFADYWADFRALVRRKTKPT